MPKVDRLCMVCEMDISAHGDIAAYRFYPAVMHSRARLTYTRVAQVLENPHGEAALELRHLVPQLQSLYALYQSLTKARALRGAIDFETVETQMFFDDQGKIERIVPTQRNDAQRLIEECMLAANVCASDFLSGHDHPALYRVHEGPTPEKLAALREFLREFGLQLGGGDQPHAKDYARLLERIKSRPDVQLLQTVMLRSLRQAVYSPDNVGHFGLAYEAYTHFTSPIRRYPDLLIHRSIKAVLEGKRYDTGDWHEIGVHCSETERRADEATRDVDAWLKCYYMQDRIGERFSGTVSGVTSFGVFVALDQVYVEGLVHISELGSDYFHYNAAKHQLLGERTGRRFRLGDRVPVKLVRVDLETSKIDFVLDDRSRCANDRQAGDSRTARGHCGAQAPAEAVLEVFLDPGRNDPRARRVTDLARAGGVRVHHADAARLDGLAKGSRHQGVVAFVEETAPRDSLEQVLEGTAEPPLLLVLDGVQDPHNLEPACGSRTQWGACGDCTQGPGRRPQRDGVQGRFRSSGKRALHRRDQSGTCAQRPER
jgi:ribonuclease R